MRSPPETTVAGAGEIPMEVCKFYVHVYITNKDDTRILVYDVGTGKITDLPLDEWCGFVGKEKFINVPLLGGAS